jgi:multiple sugar transport system substrate-binding protein
MEEFGGTVDVVESPYTGMREKVLTALTTGAGTYDVIYAAGEWDGETYPFLTVLDSFIERDNFDIDDYYPKALGAMGAFEGVGRFGIPFAAGSYGLAYRKDIFDAEGMSPPATWAEYMEMAKKLQEKYGPEGMYATAVTPTGGSAWKSWSSRYWEQGERLFDDNHKPLFANEAGAKAYQMLMDLMPYMPPDVVSWDNPEINAAFLDGSLVMAETWPTFIAGDVENPDKSKVVGKVAYAAVPGGANLYAWSWSVAKDSENQEMAWAYVKYLNSKENVARWVKEFGTDVTRQSALADDAFRSGALANGRLVPFQLAIFGEWWDAANRMTSEVMSGQKAPDQALADNAKLWEELLATITVERDYTGD